MTQSQNVSVEFGIWQAGSAEPETPVLVKVRSVENEALELEGAGSTNGKSRGRMALVNVTNLRDAAPYATENPPAAIEQDEVETTRVRKSTRNERRTRMISKLREDLSVQAESYAEVEKIAMNAEKMASDVVTHSNIQLALMEEALEDAVMLESQAIEGWKSADHATAQVALLLRERERLWARAMWKYAYNAVLRAKAKSAARPPERSLEAAPEGFPLSAGQEHESSLRMQRGRSRTRKSLRGQALTEDAVHKMTRRQIRAQKHEMLDILDRLIDQLSVRSAQ